MCDAVRCEPVGNRDAVADEVWLDRQCQKERRGHAKQWSMTDRRRVDISGSFQWHDGLLVGHGEIDADHRRFFAFLAGLQRPRDGGGDETDGADVERLFIAVLDDLDRHLAREESIVDRMGFPGAFAHKAGHRLLHEQAMAALAIGRDGEWTTALRLLATSVLEHIVEDDGKLRPLFGAMEASHS